MSAQPDHIGLAGVDRQHREVELVADRDACGDARAVRQLEFNSAIVSVAGHSDRQRRNTDRFVAAFSLNREDGKPESKPDAATKVDPKSADPLGDLAKVKAAEPKADAKSKVDTKAETKADVKAPEAKPVEAKAAEPKVTEPVAEAKPASADPFIYFVQAGAYRTTEEAQAQRAKTALLGLDTKISERDQGGRTVYRVRVGPLDKAEAERVRAKLDAAHIDSAMVRVQR